MGPEQKGNKPEDDDELTRNEPADMSDEEALKRLENLRRISERREKSGLAEEKTRLGVGVELPIDAEPFNPEYAKKKLDAALEAAVKTYGAMHRIESDREPEQTVVMDTATIGRRVQAITIAREWINGGKAADVVADQDLMDALRRELKPAAIRALKKLAGK